MRRVLSGVGDCHGCGMGERARGEGAPRRDRPPEEPTAGSRAADSGGLAVTTDVRPLAPLAPPPPQ
jgi:hypothetical protein